MLYQKRLPERRQKDGSTVHTCKVNIPDLQVNCQMLQNYHKLKKNKIEKFNIYEAICK